MLSERPIRLSGPYVITIVFFVYRKHINKMFIYFYLATTIFVTFISMLHFLIDGYLVHFRIFLVCLFVVVVVVVVHEDDNDPATCPMLL